MLITSRRRKKLADEIVHVNSFFPSSPPLLLFQSQSASQLLSSTIIIFDYIHLSVFLRLPTTKEDLFNNLGNGGEIKKKKGSIRHRHTLASEFVDKCIIDRCTMVSLYSHSY